MLIVGLNHHALAIGVNARNRTLLTLLYISRDALIFLISSTPKGGYATITIIVKMHHLKVLCKLSLLSKKQDCTQLSLIYMI